MAATIQKILKPTKYRAVDTSTSLQKVSQNLLTGDNTNFASGYGDWLSVRATHEHDTNQLKVTATDDTSSPIGIYLGNFFTSGTFGNHAVGDKIKIKCKMKTTGTAATQTTDTVAWIGDLKSTTQNLDDVTVISNPNLTSSYQTYEFDTTYTGKQTHLYIALHSVETTDSDDGEEDIFFYDDIEIYKLENFQNNNHGQIYSGRGLEFDGVGDYLSIAESTLSTPTESFTIACWMKSTGSSTWQTIYGNNTGFANGIWVACSSSEQLVIGIKDVIPTYTYFKSVTAAFKVNTWYRLVVSFERTATTVKGVMYLNGEPVELLDFDSSKKGWYEINQDTVYSNAASPTVTDIGHTGTAYNVGHAQISQGYPWEGHLSDFQLWHKAWTQSDVTFDYLNPESLALNNGGTSLTESNLKLWYPMQDGHRGQQSYVLDGAGTGLGPELATDMSASAWTKGYIGGSTTDITITDNADGSVTFETGETTNWQTISIPIVNEIGVTYKVSITGEALASTDDDDDNFYWRFGDSYNDGHDTDNFSQNWKISEGAHTETLYFPSASSSNPAFLIGMFKKASGNVHKFRLDSVTLKAINQKHHATTVFYGDDLWDGADNSVANWAANGSSTTVASADCIKITPGTSSDASKIELRDSKDLTTDLTIGRTYRLTCQSATDVVGDTTVVAIYNGSNNNDSNANTTATNVVTNGDFQSALSTGWVEVDLVGTDGVINRTSGEKHNGTHSVYLQTAADNDRVCIRNGMGSMTLGDKYLVTYWTRQDSTNPGQIIHRIFNAAGEDPISATASGVSTTAWTQVAVQFIAGTTGSHTLELSSPTGDSSVNTGYIDDVVVTKFIDNTIDYVATNATTNYLRVRNSAGNDSAVNGTFEGSIAEGDNDDSWIDDGTQASQQVNLVKRDSDANSGSSCMQGTLVSGETVGYLSYKKTDYIIGRKYYARCYMRKGDSQTMSAFQPFAGTTLRAETESGTAISPSDSYQLVNMNFTATSTTMYINLKFTGTAEHYGLIDDFIILPQENTWIDDIVFKEEGTASGWTDADQQLDIPQTALQSYNQLAWAHHDHSDGFFVRKDDIASSTLINLTAGSMSWWSFIGANPGGMTMWHIFDNAASTEDYLRCYLDISGFLDIVQEKGNAPQFNYSIDLDTLGWGSNGYLGRWIHFVWTNDNTTAIPVLYINGEKVTLVETVNTDKSGWTDFATDSDTNRISLLSGSWGDGSGAMTETSFWNKQLSQAEVNELYNDGIALDATTHSAYNATYGSSALKGYWRDNGLSTWTDLSGGGNHLSPNNAGEADTMLLPAGVAASRDNQGFLMNRQKDTNSLNLTTFSSPYVKIPETTYDVDGTATSFAFWVNLGSTIDGLGGSNWSTVLSNSGVNGYKWIAFKTDLTELQIEGDTNTDRAYATFTALTLDTWYHFAIVCDGSGGVVIYKDGVTTGVTMADGTIGVNLTINQIGRSYEDSSGGTYEFDGQLDDILIYDGKALSAPEVLRNYNAGKRSHR